ncbi:hypothetical protein B0H16DRAFT_1820575 [Mycena metata]|uniref:Uncharacterized protein n=1 Tax=Mycena metata TaxID=1033252 RepID=A0AAD7J8V1_9AGAR|nr:hypothetical protein B0H16DRAFT_1820575 [Mycena metata]
MSDSSRSSVALLPSNPIPKPNRGVVPIPKAVTDKLSEQEARISFLERTLKTNDQVHKKFASEITDLDGENHQLLHRVTVLEELVERQTATIDRLFELVEGDEDTVSAMKTAKKGTRDNVLNVRITFQFQIHCIKDLLDGWQAATRKVFLVAMGLPKTAKYKEAALVLPVKTGGSYIPDPATPNGTLLRPDWKLGFNGNSVWHVPMLKFTRQKVPKITPAITDTIMQSKSEEDILARLAAVFRNISAEYRKAPQGQPLVTVPEEANAVASTSDATRTNRRKGRKVRKCEERIKVLQEEGIKVEEEWKFLLTPPYQSTDESNDSDVIDPDTDTEKADEIPVKSTQKPWNRQTPTYRSDAADYKVCEWEVLVMKYRKNHERTNRGKAGKPKIHRAAIHPDWLEGNPDQDTPSRILEEKAVEGDDKGNGNDDDDDY